MSNEKANINKLNNTDKIDSLEAQNLLQIIEESEVTRGNSQVELSQSGSKTYDSDKIREKATCDLTQEEKVFCHDLFLDYYKREYGQQDPKNFEFKLENLEEWLETQLRENIGERCLISDKGFLSFSIPDTTKIQDNSNQERSRSSSSSTNEYINIFQFVLNKEEAGKVTGSMAFLKELGKKYPKRAFRSAIRKTQKEKALVYKGMGCKITDDVNLPGFSSDYYLGVEMPSRLIKTLSIFLPSKK